MEANPARVVHWYKVDDDSSMMAVVSAADFTSATAEAFERALQNVASPKPYLPVRVCVAQINAAASDFIFSILTCICFLDIAALVGKLQFDFAG